MQVDFHNRDEVEESVRLALHWLTEIAQVQSEQLNVEDYYKGHLYTNWKGAIRGEYAADIRKWGFYCPVWHTGQAVKALVMAYRYFGAETYLSAARLGAAFIYTHQVWDETDPNHGLIQAYEDFPDKVNTSAVFEALDGLMLLAELEESEEQWLRIELAADFIVRHCYQPDTRVFKDSYDPVRRCALTEKAFRTKNDVGGRPLLDDGVLLTLYRKTGRQDFLDVHLNVAKRLIEDQNPPGNWIDYSPCNAAQGTFHPRSAYWWGYPFIKTYRETGNREYLQTALATGEFTLKAMRRDGGFFRTSDTTFNTLSFGHATSASACSSIVFQGLYAETKEEKWLEAALRALSFCFEMQLRQTLDPNLTGVILEKVLPPGGTDRSPYYIRDVGTIFFIQAAVEYLKGMKNK